MSAAAGKPAPFPWDEVMALGFGLLRLAPKDFWAMTPREVASAMKLLPARTGDAPGRTALAELMTRFPDGIGRERPWQKR